MDYISQVTVPSQVCSGVWFRIRSMSFGRRLDLMKRVRELAGRLEYFQAGGTPTEQIEAAVLSAEIDQLYLNWGLAAVEGLRVDGEPVDAETLFEKAPEALCVEAVAAVKRECGLSEEERKN